MSVYVDHRQEPYKSVDGPLIKLNRLTADTIGELHFMARKLSIRKKWFTDSDNPHYDIGNRKRLKAMKYGAIKRKEHG